MRLIHWGYSKFIWTADLLGGLPELATRLGLGLIFMHSGWGKLQNLERTTAFFVSLGVPAARVQAPFVALTELIAGALVFGGLFTRAASFPLIITMAVALLTAKASEIHGVMSLFDLSEFLYALLLFWLIVKGGGGYSLDRFVRKEK